jgi:hypothetical protein
MKRALKALAAGALLAITSTSFAAEPIGTYVIGDANVLTALTIKASGGGNSAIVPSYVFYSAPTFVANNLSSLQLQAAITSGSGAFNLLNPNQTIPIQSTPGPLAYIVYIGKGVDSMSACVPSEASTIEASALALISGPLKNACTVNGSNKCSIGPINCGQFANPTTYSIDGAYGMKLNFMTTSVSLQTSNAPKK